MLHSRLDHCSALTVVRTTPAPVYDLNRFEPHNLFPPEICEKIWEYTLPSGYTYTFDDGQLRASSRGAIPSLTPFLLNRRSYRKAKAIWLAQNEFTLEANALSELEFRHVNYNEVKQDSIEASIQWLTSMVEFSPSINATLDCGLRAGWYLREFFEIVKLLRTKDVLIAVDGTLPDYHSSIGFRARRINIVFPAAEVEAMYLKELHLEILDLGHQARKSQLPLNQLGALHHEILRRDETPLEMAWPNCAFIECRLKLPLGFDVFKGPNDLLYRTPQAAVRSRHAVTRGKRPTTISPFFAKRIVKWLK
jgi:hypothetical protein